MLLTSIWPCDNDVNMPSRELFGKVIIDRPCRTQPRIIVRDETIERILVVGGNIDLIEDKLAGVNVAKGILLLCLDQLLEMANGFIFADVDWECMVIGIVNDEADDGDGGVHKWNNLIGGGAVKGVFAG